MTTLSGFEDHHQTAEAWRDYIARLDERIAKHRRYIAKLRQGWPETREEWRREISRDIIYEHRTLAQYELDLLTAPPETRAGD